MRVKNLTPLLFGATVTSTNPPRPEMAAVVRGTFAIVPGGTVKELEGIPQIAQGPLTADVFREGDEDRSGECLYPNDFADFKLNAEVLLTGSCLAPRGKPIVECFVRFTVGDWSKTLRVSGDRRFTQRGISEPEPFTAMPLDYAHAFGGPGYAQNPVGKGFEADALPNVEHPRGLVLSRGDRPEPASFAPLNPAWPQRAGKMGKRYDREYQRKRAPYYADDLDWTYFHAAPADQQLPGYLRGDEELSFHHLHPAAPVVMTRLPSLRVRVFVRDRSGRSREVAIRLDTLLADMDKQRVTLTWRGLDPVGEHDLSDVTSALVAAEPLGEPRRPSAHYEDMLERFEADPIGLADALPEELRAELAKMEEGAGAGGGPDPVSGMLAGKLGGMAKEQQEAIRQAIARATEQGGSRFDLHARLREIVAAAEREPDTPPPVLPPAAGGAPRVYLRESWKQALDQLAAAKKSALAAGSQPRELAEAEARLRDPELRKLDPTLREPTTDLPGPGADLSGQDLSGQDLSGMDLTGVKLEGAVLIGTNLKHAILAGASLRGAMLFKADLTGANLREADLSLCNAASAVAEEADLRGARLDDAYFKGARLRRARLDGAEGSFVTFVEADLTEASATGARLDQSELSKATLEGADFSGASLTRCKLLEARAQGIDLRRAALDRSSLMDADLSGARLGSARGERTIWIRARLDRADLRLAWFRNGDFTEVSAKGGVFTGADLRESRFYRAVLEGATLSRSNLFGADLCRARLGATDFKEANLYDAKLLQASGEGSSFEGANVERALFNEAG